MIQLNKYFWLQELVPEETLIEYGKNAIWHLDKRMIDGIYEVRKICGPLIVNNWEKGGELSYRGYRPSTYKEGATDSQHRAGRAVDFSSNHLSPIELRKKIIDNWSCLGTYFSTMELDTPTWVHLDCRQITQRTKAEGPFFVQNPNLGAK